MNLAWILLFLPLVAAALNQLVLRRHSLVPYVSTASALATLVISILLLGKGDSPKPIEWASVGDFHLTIGITLDTLSTGMMLVVTGIGTLVHIFSLAYMKDDEAKARYFTGLSLFMFSMTGIVLANNFIMTFIFWELVGVSSYLLIGHWYQKDSAANAAKKAFLCNRVGDFGFLIGILLLWGLGGTLVFSDMQEGIFKGAGALHPEAFTGLLSAAVLCIFCGAVGKSAQVPLHVWLPDAMEGPTPVSALIHAATMVAAGVYMLARLHLSIGAELFEGLLASDVIAWVGGFTALVAALMAVQQDDIKKILAYSTLSQLGYMVMAVGLVDSAAGMFHLFTHAWFKALLFLGSGAVIYACHHQQNIWKMGGLFKKMPITGSTFLLGYAALIAVPFTSGFFSKELVLHAAKSKSPFLFWIAAFVAVLTAFYMTRLVLVAFFGKARTKDADHAKEVGPLMWVPLAILAVLALIAGYGFFNQLSPATPAHAGEFHLNPLFFISIAALAIGVSAAFILYKGKDKDPLDIPLLRERFYVDRFYDKYLVPTFNNAVAAITHFFDELIINGLLVGGLSRGAASVGNLCRAIQSGKLQAYAFAVGLGVILVVYFTVFY
ncbi:MAG: NADH-quinone oxidoreductase subunit L [Akkermansiaceae bacterium]|nr:NADH-quinone oxidoreductase subunit L [Akkermansiaceae bacterium]